MLTTKTLKLRESGARFLANFIQSCCQDLRAISHREAPSYATLKKNDGDRLFVRFYMLECKSNDVSLAYLATL